MLRCLLLLGLSASTLAQDILLPPAPGPYNVTIRTSQLDDFSRPEIFADEPGVHRRLMISVFSPVIKEVSSLRSPYMPPDVAKYISAVYSSRPPPDDFTIDFSRFVMRASSVDVTHGLPHDNTTVPGYDEPSSFPLIIFGPGLGFSRLAYNVLSQFLASYGFIVVSTDHPYDGIVVQFPDGSYTLFSPEAADSLEHLERSLSVRTADERFVLDQLSTNRTLTQLVYPPGVRPCSVENVGIWGHSFGGATAVTAMLQDERFKAGINIDGTVFGPAPHIGFDKPLVLWQSEFADDGSPQPDGDATWTELWAHLSGFKRHLMMRGSRHPGLTDLKLLADLEGTSWPLFGTIDGLLEVETLAAYARDFFGFALEGKDGGLILGPSKDYPQVKFLQ